MSANQPNTTLMAQRLFSCVNFLRWSTNFPQFETQCHSNSQKIIQLSAMQSGYFSFRVDPDSGNAHVGAQAFEAKWLEHLPITNAFVHDRLYLHVEQMECLGESLNEMMIGIFIDSEKKLAQLKKASHLLFDLVEVEQGRAVYQKPLRQDKVAILSQDPIESMKEARKQVKKKRDISRML